MEHKNFKFNLMCAVAIVIMWFFATKIEAAPLNKAVPVEKDDGLDPFYTKEEMKWLAEYAYKKGQVETLKKLKVTCQKHGYFVLDDIKYSCKVVGQKL